MKAERDKERADLEAKILASVEGYHVAGAAEAEALAAAAASRAEQAEYLVQLVGLGVAEAEIEAMCEIDGAGLRRAKRQVGERKKSSTPKPVEAEPAAREPLGSGSAAA